MCFNPRPPIPAGETLGEVALASARHVSIHARRYRRAKLDGGEVVVNPVHVSIHARRYRRAKPQGLLHLDAHDLVSIHARRYRRAKRRGVAAALQVQSFNPRPPIPAGETANTWMSMSICVFQSTPADTGGRNLGLITCSRSTACFNPRPPIPAGETAGEGAAGHGLPVSIHARRYRRAKQCATCTSSAGLSFQSTPADTGG